MFCKVSVLPTTQSQHLGGQRQVDPCEYKAILYYTVPGQSRLHSECLSLKTKVLSKNLVTFNSYQVSKLQN